MVARVYTAVRRLGSTLTAPLAPTMMFLNGDLAASPVKTSTGVQGSPDIWLSSRVEGSLGRIRYHFRLKILRHAAALRMRPFVCSLFH